MDIEKDSDREAFEAIAENIRLLRGAKFKDGEYVALSLFDESSKELAAQLNYGWSMWLSSKNQAIPEGFVVVPKEPTQELLNKMQDFFVGAFENGLTGGQSIHCAYIAMIEAAQEPTPLKVGDLVEPKDYRYILASGACRYPYAYVVNTNPFQLMSEEGDMYWRCTVEVDGYKLLKSNVQLPKGVVDRMIREGLIAPVEAQEQAND